ncbi:MAG: hypothetical protein K6A33_05815 [Clostridiales bacterium]|nr:hypothetical protein [Clostridiales bacterium]
MKPEKLYEAIGGLDDGILAETEAVRSRPNPKTKPFRQFARRWGTLAAAVVIAAGGILYGWTHRVEVTYATCIAEPYLAGANVYPNLEEFTVEDYLAWREETDEKVADVMPKGEFAERSTATLFASSSGENLFYSPLNAELCLVSLADMTAGQTRTQLMNIAGEEDLTDFENRMEEQLKVFTRQDAVTVCVTYGDLNAHFYIPEDQVVVDGKIDSERVALYDPLQKKLYDSANRRMYSSPFSFIRFVSGFGHSAGWTGGKSTFGFGGLESIQREYGPEDRIELDRYLYVRSAWVDPADLAKKRRSTFSGKSGECEADYVVAPKAYTVNGDGFSAVRIPLLVGGDLWLALPEEGKSPESLLTAGTLFSAVKSGDEGKETTAAVPCFSVASEIDLKDLFTELGADKAFIPGEANLSPFLGTDKEFTEFESAWSYDRITLKTMQNSVNSILGKIEEYFTAAAEADASSPKNEHEIRTRLKSLEELIREEEQRLEDELRQYRQKAEDESAAEKIYAVTDVPQPIRLMINETGVKTGAYSIYYRSPREAPKKGTPDAAMIIDRPFAVLITAEDGTVLLAGAVNDIVD